MNTTNPIRVHDASADTYDASVEEYHSHLHDLLFGMCYEFIQPGHSLLDIGIGTGLSSVNFARAGVDVYGMDPSSNMIDQCRKKGFAKELKQHSLTDPPLRYHDKAFSHVIACGVFRDDQITIEKPLPDIALQICLRVRDVTREKPEAITDRDREERRTRSMTAERHYTDPGEARDCHDRPLAEVSLLEARFDHDRSPLDRIEVMQIALP